MITQVLLMMLVGIVAGTLGSILGIGGGMIITPFLTVALGLDIKYAIGASIIAVIATSSGASVAYLKDDLLNLRVAMFLELATTTGAIIGAVLTGLVPSSLLSVLFGLLLVYSAYNMYRKLRNKQKNVVQNEDDKWSKKLKLNGRYYDHQSQKQISYAVKNVPGGFAMMTGAGFASGLLGIGSGAFKVIAMDTIMKMPLKPSTATSNLMMGVTAAASATVYFFNGSMRFDIAAPLALGILLGAMIGSRIMVHLKPKVIRMIFIPIILYMGIQMALKGFGVM